MTLTGRTVLESTETEVNRENVVEVLQSVLNSFEKNANEIDYLQNYCKGVQPILYRQKAVRPEIKNEIVENHANEIVSFKKGYTFGEPVQYVRRTIRDEGKSDVVGDNEEKLLTLNEMMASEEKASIDEKLAEDFFTCGTAYRMVLPKQSSDDDTESDIEIDVLDPKSTAIVYNTGFKHKPIMSIQKIVVNDYSESLNNPKEKDKYCIYTPNKYFEVSDSKVVFEQDHILGYIPIFEYPNNSSRLGSFEIVLPILDAINNVDSNRMDGIEQFIQSFMKFVNVNIDDKTFRQFREEGAILIKSEPGNPADVGIISSEMDQTQTQIYVDHLYQMALIICGMPDRNGTGRANGDTGQAVMLRDGWASAETKAKETEAIFKISEKKFLKFVLRNSTKLKGLKISDIDIKFTRNKTDNLLVKTQGLTNMLAAGVSPEIAFNLSNLFSDSEQACKDSEQYLAKWLPKNETEESETNQSDLFGDPSQRSDKNAKKDREVSKTQATTEKS